MSLWIYKKDKDGKQNLYWVDIPLFSIPLIISLFLAVFITQFFYFIAIGFIFILIAKISLFSKGIWISWGSKQMSKPFKLLYQAGYILVGIGVSIILLIYI
jgi:hypothetical protein